MTDLEVAGKEDSLLTAYMLITLVFDKKSQEDQDWLKRRWNVLSDELRDTWVYQEILKEGREAGREEERRKWEEERKQELERWRHTMLGVVQRRFANQKMELLAEGQAAIIHDPTILQDLILKIAAADTEEEAQDYLLSWKKSS